MNRDTPHILLVNPWIHDFAAYDFWARPLGLLGLAAMLREQGCRVSYIDCLDRFHPRMPSPIQGDSYGRGPFRKSILPTPAQFPDVRRRFARYGIDPEWLLEDLRELPAPDLVLVTSGMTYWYTGVQETIARIKAVFPKVPIVLGGIYASLCADHARRWSGADEVLTGPAGRRLLERLHSYTGWTASRPCAADDLDACAFPAFDLQRRIPYVALLTSRGCPFACAYCAAHLLEPHRLLRSPSSVLEEILYWHRGWGVSDFVLYDDAFLFEPEAHALPVLEAIARRAPRLRFHTPNALHVRGLTPEAARLLLAAGFTTLRLGLETVDSQTRAMLDRKVRAPEFERAADALRTAGFSPRQVGAYLLAGLPGQPTETVMASIDTVKRIGITPVLAYYSPIPGTALWPAALAASRYDLASDPLYTNNSVLPCRPEPFDWKWISDLKQRINA